MAASGTDDLGPGYAKSPADLQTGIHFPILIYRYKRSWNNGAESD